MPLDGAALPLPKDAQLARGERRYRRQVASAKEWIWLRQVKGGACRCCSKREQTLMAFRPFGQTRGVLHHLVPRSRGGDDLADNLVMVCEQCHGKLHRREPNAVRRLLASLTDAEYVYCVTKGGETFFESFYGLRYERSAA